MTAPDSQRFIPWGSVLLTLALGVIARDCILMASALMLAIHVARVDVLTRDGIDPMRVAIHCWVAGAAAVLLALALIAMVVGVNAGLWAGNRLETRFLLLALGLCIVIVAVTTPTNETPSARLTLFILGVVMLAFAAVARSIGGAGPCAFALMVASFATASGWRFARETGSELARSTVRLV